MASAKHEILKITSKKFENVGDWVRPEETENSEISVERI